MLVVSAITVAGMSGELFERLSASDRLPPRYSKQNHKSRLRSFLIVDLVHDDYTYGCCSTMRTRQMEVSYLFG